MQSKVLYSLPKALSKTEKDMYTLKIPAKKNSGPNMLAFQRYFGVRN
jgi:hypothetical protein